MGSAENVQTREEGMKGGRRDEHSRMGRQEEDSFHVRR